MLSRHLQQAKPEDGTRNCKGKKHINLDSVKEKASNDFVLTLIPVRPML